VTGEDSGAGPQGYYARVGGEPRLRFSRVAGRFWKRQELEINEDHSLHLCEQEMDVRDS